MAKPVVITRQTRANEAAARFREQYAGWKPDALCWNGSSPRQIADALEALGPTPDPDAVDKIIGRDSWTAPPKCNGCSARARVVVRVGAEEDYESATTVLCETCVRTALAAIEGARPPVRRWRVWGNATKPGFAAAATVLQAESAQEAADVWAWRTGLIIDTETCVAEADEQGIVHKGTMIVSVTGSALRHLERVRGEKS